MHTLLFSLFFCFFPLIPHTFDKIADEHMKSLTYDESQWEGCPQNGSYYDYLVWEFNRQQHLPLWQKRFDAFYFVKNHAQQQVAASEVLDWTTVQDLNLLSGSRSLRDHSLMAQIDRTQMQVGKIMLMHLLTHPTTDIAELRDRQAMVHALLADQQLLDALQKLFAQLARAEPLALSLWQKQDSFTTNFCNQKLRQLPFGKKIFDYVQKNSTIMEIYERASEVQESALLATQIAGTVLLPVYATVLILDQHELAKQLCTMLDSWGISSKAVPLVTVTGLSLYYLNQCWDNSISKAASNAAAGAQYGIWSFYNIDMLRSNLLLMRVMQTKLMQIAKLFEGMQELRTLLSRNAFLKEKCKPLHELEQVLDCLPEQFSDVADLFELLRSNTFKGDASFFSRWGRIITAFKLFDAEKDKLVPGLLALGKMDALVAIARLYQEGQERSTKGLGAGWCFPDYGEDAAAPSASLEHFWNPFLDPTKVVTNSLALGGDSNPRIVIITGSNAGGKSTITKSLVESFILGQTLGIVPARSCVFTPFAKIMTYLNITDDIAANNSLFKAGVLRAQELLTTATQLGEHEFSFMALDEVFNGTTYREGQAAAYSLVETLGNNGQVLSTVVTHFPLLTMLEEKTVGLFKNYRVSVKRGFDGHLSYPFKLESGVSEQSIALDILKDEGFATDFLERAYAVLAGTLKEKESL